MTELRFDQSGCFKVMQLTDIHFMNEDDRDEKSLALIRRLIAQEHPDLIVISGDTVYGPKNLENLKPALEPVYESGIPWTWTFGNHDAEDGHSKEELFSYLTGLPGCLAYDAAADITGVGNHDLEIRNDRGELRWLISLLDSGDYMRLSSGSSTHSDAIGGYDMVKHDQITWFSERIKTLEKSSRDFGILMFMHIPLPEYNEVWESRTCYGEKNEAVCCPKLNSGLFSAMLESGHVRGLFCGHDHINDYVGDLYGIKLGYGRATGYNTYGRDGYLRGARLFILKEDNTSDFESRIRLEDNSIIDGLDRVHEVQNSSSAK